MAGSACAELAPVSVASDAIRSISGMARSLDDGCDALPNDPNKCPSLLGFCRLAFKVNIVTITEPSLHSRNHIVMEDSTTHLEICCPINDRRVWIHTLSLTLTTSTRSDGRKNSSKNPRPYRQPALRARIAP